MKIQGLEQQRIRRDVDGYFDKIAHVFQFVETRAANGSVIQTFPANPTKTSPCQLAPMSPTTEQFYSERLGGRQGWHISIRDNIRVRLSDIITVDGRRFEVLGTSRGRSYQWRIRVDATELT